MDMVSERFIEPVERVSMCGGFVAIMKRIENVDVDEKTYVIFHHYSVLCRTGDYILLNENWNSVGKIFKIF